MTDVEPDRHVITEFAELMLRSVAPDELPVLEESAAEYFDDPRAALAEGGGDVPLGSGLTVAMASPYLLAVASAVIPVLAGFVVDLAKDIGKDLIKEPVTDRIRRLFQRSPGEPATVALTADQLAQVRAVVLRQGVALSLPTAEAELLADAAVGALHSGP